MYEEELKKLSDKMDKSIVALKNEFTSIRTGQANASLLDRVFVEYNGSRTPIVPMNDGNLIRMAIPQLTEDRRKELVKVVNKKAEEGKVAIRNIRRDGNDFLKKEAKNSDVSKDVIKETEDKVQKLTDKKIKELEAATEKKIKEIMSV